MSRCRQSRPASTAPGPNTAIPGDEVTRRFPWAHHDCEGARTFVSPTTSDPVQALVDRTWTPTRSVTGADGFLAPEHAGNVLRPYSAFKLRLP